MLQFSMNSDSQAESLRKPSPDSNVMTYCLFKVFSLDDSVARFLIVILPLKGPRVHPELGEQCARYP